MLLCCYIQLKKKVTVLDVYRNMACVSSNSYKHTVPDLYPHSTVQHTGFEIQKKDLSSSEKHNDLLINVTISHKVQKLSKNMCKNSDSIFNTKINLSFSSNFHELFRGVHVQPNPARSSSKLRTAPHGRPGLI